MSIEPIGIIGDGKKLAVIAICNLTSVSNKAYATHLQFAYRLAKDNPDYQFILFTPYRMSIANFRNMAAVAALESDSEYLMFIDDDAVLINQASIFKSLKDKIDDNPNAHIVMPVVYVRGYPFNPMFFKYLDQSDPKNEGKLIDFYTDFKEQPINNDKNLLEVAAIGCHTCLIKTELLRAMDKPFFLTGMNHTEDVYFCLKARDYVENCGIYVATDLCVGHLLDPLWVDNINVEMLRKFYKETQLDNQFNIRDYLDQPKQLIRELNSVGEEFNV